MRRSGRLWPPIPVQENSTPPPIHVVHLEEQASFHRHDTLDGVHPARDPLHLAGQLHVSAQPDDAVVNIDPDGRRVDRQRLGGEGLLDVPPVLVRAQVDRQESGAR